MKRLKVLVFGLLSLVLLFPCAFKENKNSPSITSDNKDVWWEYQESRDPFLILEYINIYPDSDNFIEALKVFIKEINILRKESLPTPPDLSCVGNCIEVFIDTENEITLFADSIKIDCLREKSLVYLLNEEDNVELPISESVVDKFGNEAQISKGYFLITSNSDSLEFIQNVVIELRKSILDYMNQKSLEIYHENFNRLEDDERTFISSLFNDRIRFFYINGQLEI